MIPVLGAMMPRWLSVHSPARIAAQFRAGVTYGRALLTDRISVPQAKEAIRNRFHERDVAFCEMLDRGVFDHPRSPYHLLFRAAGYGRPRLMDLIAEVGVDAALHRLAADGVFVTIEEFKGICEIRRHGHVFRATPADFDNPAVTFGLPAFTGGTRGDRRPVMISLDSHRLGAQHLAVALHAYELTGRPVAVALPSAHGASLWAVLSLAAIGNPSARWFNQQPGRGSIDRWHPVQLGTRWAAARLGIRLPRPQYVPVGAERVMLAWLTAQRGGGGILTTPSTALRIALAARRARRRLDGASFVVIGEPLTPRKAAAISEAGGRAFSSLGFTEFGRATYGCGAPASPDEMHLCGDAVALVTRRRLVDAHGPAVNALLFTALRPDARKVLINVETGDYAAVSRRACGCLLESVGWTDHLEEVRSFEKLNAEGRLFFGSSLITLLEHTLPDLLGGTAADFQLVEEEDGAGFTRFSIRVHPRLGVIDEGAALACANQALAAENAQAMRLLSGTGTLRVVRAAPAMTGAGKVMPLHRVVGVEEGTSVR